MNNNEPFNENSGKGCLIFSAIFLMLVSLLFPIAVIEILNNFCKVNHSIWSYLAINLSVLILFVVILLISEFINKINERRKRKKIQNNNR
jgi:hypothetical protein